MDQASGSHIAGVMNGHVANKDDDHQTRNSNTRQQQQQHKVSDQPTNSDTSLSAQQSIKSSNRHTLHAEEVHFVFLEPFIHTGYRVTNQPWRYYFYSVCWLHNESLNVWTHALGCFCILVRALFLGLELDGFGDPRSGPVVGFALACFLSNLLSSLAHLLHSKSPRHHYILFFYDYAGVTFYNLGNAIGSMYSCSHPHMFALMETYYLPVVVVLCWLSFLVCVLARLRYKGHFAIRRKVIMVLVFGLLGGFIAWPMAGRYVDCMEDEACSLSSLNHITIVFVFFVLDAVCYSAHAPERWWPGYFDVWGHGHQWFHVGVMVTQQLQLHALHVDLVHLDRGNHAKLDMLSMLSAFLTLGLASWLAIVALGPAVDNKVTEVHHHHEQSMKTMKLKSH